MGRIHIKGGTVYDGGGGDPFLADITLENKTITAITPPETAKDKPADGEVVNASGLAVAPGFIDCHSHADWILPQPDHAAILRPLLLQGVTTSVGGNCGFSPFPVDASSAEAVLEQSRFLTNDAFSFQWNSQDEYLAHLERQGLCCNFATLAGHGPLRFTVKGLSPEPMSTAERRRLAVLLEDALARGACGASIGLSYVPGIFADDAEIETVFRTVAGAGKVLTVHGRTYSRVSPCYPAEPGHQPHCLQDLDYFLDMAAKTGAKLHISHVLLKGRTAWNLWPDALDRFERAADKGVDVTFGVIPYHWGNTLITTLFPKWFLEDFSGNIARPDQVKRLEREVFETEKNIGRDFSDLHLLWGVNPALAHLEGKSFSAIADELELDEISACLHIAKQSGGRAKILTASYSGKEGSYPEPLEKLLGHPLSMVEIDTILTSSSGPQNPASYGAFPKWLGHYARDCDLVSLSEAVRKITGAPADRFGLRGRGYIREGNAADIVVFDPARINAPNTVREPSLPPVGIVHAVLNGKTTLRRGVLLGDGVGGHILRGQ